MKKPFMSLKTKFDIAKFIFGLLLCAAAVYLLFTPEESVAVFASGGDGGHQSLFGIVREMV